MVISGVIIKKQKITAHSPCIFSFPYVGTLRLACLESAAGSFKITVIFSLEVLLLLYVIRSYVEVLVVGSSICLWTEDSNILGMGAVCLVDKNLYNIRRLLLASHTLKDLFK